jgi:hypothetical protein
MKSISSVTIAATGMLRTTSRTSFLATSPLAGDVASVDVTGGTCEPRYGVNAPKCRARVVTSLQRRSRRREVRGRSVDDHEC